jgi:hypothetical protein
MLEHATASARSAGGWLGLLGRRGEDYLSLIALGGGVCFGVIAVGMLLLVALGVLPR